MLGVVGCPKVKELGVEPTPMMSGEPLEEPTPEMTGEMWETRGVPPARAPRATRYQGLSVGELWKELSAPENDNAALVTLKRPELKRGYFNGVVLISEEEIQKARQQLLEIPGVIPWDGLSHEIEMPIMPDGRRYPGVVLRIGSMQALHEVLKVGTEVGTLEVVEPLFVAQDGAGCSLPSYTPNPADSMLFGNRIPWSFNHLGVIQAWDLYKVNNVINRPGYLVRIGVVDTGVYQDEHQLTTVVLHR
jgi:hypothetical protein